MREKLVARLFERDARIADARRRAEDDRQDIIKVVEELIALYSDPHELLKHSRLVGLDEITENEFNLNIPRYVDTFEPEPRIQVNEALQALDLAERASATAETKLRKLLEGLGFAAG